jgi:DNA-binding transcriptional LysR family regulator
MDGMDRLRTMQSFVRVMRSGSFTIAARQLGVSRALVSRHIIDLERHLGLRLLNRSTRSLTPTDEAASYLAFCEQIIGELEKGERSFVRTQDKPVEALKVVAPKSFGTENLADAILDFADSQPHIRVSLVLEDFSFRPYEFVEKGYDLALCLAAIRDSALISRAIVSLDWVLCASPDYIARHGRPKTPADLKHRSCLVHMNLEVNDRIWQFSRNQVRRSVKVEGQLLSNSALVLRKAALRSFGIAVLPRYCVAADLAAGTLVTLLPNYKFPGRPLLAVYPRAIVASRKINTFVAFLSRWFQQSNPNVAAADKRT